MLIYDFDYALRYGCYASNDEMCLSRDFKAQNERMHKHKYYELSFIVDGFGTQIINGTTYHVKKNTLILFTKDDIHSYHSVHGIPAINCCFKTKKNLLCFPNNPKTIISFLGDEDVAQVYSFFKILESELNSQTEYSEKITYNCLDALLLILQRNSSNESASDSFWDNLLSYTFENFATADLQIALEIMNMSASNFCRKFKKNFSVSYLTYVNQLRIEEAKRLLASTGYTISEISEQVGYGANICRFYQDFNKYAETTPNKFRTKLSRLPLKRTLEDEVF